MAIYQIGGQSIHSDDPALSELLANIYSSRERPLCLCRTPGIEMYVVGPEIFNFPRPAACLAARHPRC